MKATATAHGNTKGAVAIDERMKLVQDKGLTDAEHAAITAYTVDDHMYMNAAAANSPSWIKKQQAANSD